MLGVSIVLFVVLLAVLFAVAAVTAGFGDLMRPVFQDARPVGLPATKVSPDDLEALRFNVVLRGYKMTEVDAVLHRMAREIAERDAVLAELRGEGRPTSFRPPAPPGAPDQADAPTEPAPYADHDADTDEHPAVPEWRPDDYRTLPVDEPTDLPTDEPRDEPRDEPTQALPGYYTGDATTVMPALDDEGRPSDDAGRPAPPAESS